LILDSVDASLLQQPTLINNPSGVRCPRCATGKH
jgi:hypothetical protein